jgi:hypothetical protein
MSHPVKCSFVVGLPSLGSKKSSGLVVVDGNGWSLEVSASGGGYLQNNIECFVNYYGPKTVRTRCFVSVIFQATEYCGILFQNQETIEFVPRTNFTIKKWKNATQNQNMSLTHPMLSNSTNLIEFKLTIEVPKQKIRFRPETNDDIQSSLGDDLSSVLRECTMSDVTILSDGISISAHKVILCARSPVFKAMLTSGPSVRVHFERDRDHRLLCRGGAGICEFHVHG